MLLTMGVAAAAWGQVVELPEDEVLVSVRLRSIGGAVTGVAESASAQLYNPAAMAMRRPLVPQTRGDVDLALQARDHPLMTAAWGVLGVPPEDAPARRAWWQLGSDLRLGQAALAAHLRNQSWSDGEHHYAAATIGVGAGWAAPTIAVGALPQVLVFRGPAGRAVGYGGSLGTLWAPDGLPLRLGAGLRTPIRTGDTVGPGPNAVRLPAEGSVGASWSLGARNQAGDYGPERVQAVEGAPLVLLAADLVLTGGSGEARPIVPVLAGERADPVGWTAGVRAGAEASVAQHKVRLRSGFATVPGRGHATAGWLVSAGAAVQLLEDPRGLPIRGVIGGEVGPDGFSFGFGIESW